MDQSLTNVPSAQDVASPVKEAVKFEETMPNLIAEAEEVYATYDLDSSSSTPDLKLDENQQAASASSELSLKEGSESSPSLSDSDSESSDSSNAYYSLPINTDRRELSYQNIAEIQRMGDKLEIEDRNPTYEELLRKVDVYEDYLKVSNLKLEKSEEEVSWLKNELKKGVETFQSELETVYRDIKVKEADLEMERRRVVQLENKIVEGTLEVHDQLKLAREETAALKAELSLERNQVIELEEMKLSYKNQISDLEAELKALQVSLISAEENFRTEKQNMMEASVKELKSLRISLEGKLMQCEAEKMEMKTLLDDQDVQSRMKISKLKADLNTSGELVESLNKNLNGLKNKCDMIMAEKVELNAKVDEMRAEMVLHQTQKREMEEHLRQLNLENGDLIADSGSLGKLVEELRLRVVELEKEVDRQSGEIVEGAEAKREAIRQLCFTLEHYRSGYRELHEAIISRRVRVPA